jgi:hypothetical protein
MGSVALRGSGIDGAVASFDISQGMRDPWQSAEKYQPLNPFLHRPLLLGMEKEGPI